MGAPEAANIKAVSISSQQVVYSLPGILQPFFMFLIPGASHRIQLTPSRAAPAIKSDSFNPVIKRSDGLPRRRVDEQGTHSAQLASDCLLFCFFGFSFPSQPALYRPNLPSYHSEIQRRPSSRRIAWLRRRKVTSVVRLIFCLFHKLPPFPRLVNTLLKFIYKPFLIANFRFHKFHSYAPIQLVKTLRSGT